MLWRWRGRPVTAAFIAALVAAGAVSCGSGHSLPGGVSLIAVTRAPAAAATVLGDPADVAAADAAAGLFAVAPVAVIADTSRPADLVLAAAAAERVHAPLLLVPGPPAGAGGAGRRGGSGPALQARAGGPAGAAATMTSAGMVLRTAVRALGTRAVLDVGVARRLLAAQLPHTQVLTDPAGLPATRLPAPLRDVTLLVHRGDASVAASAAIATARAAGAQVVSVAGFDPRADPAAIAALAVDRPEHVIALGLRFGPARRLAGRVAVASTGVQLPGGGQVLFPMHRLLALYGYPGTPALGALGEQGLGASITRIERIASLYRPLSSVPVIPAFEIIATVAQGSPGRDGSYSYESPLAAMLPWVRRASAAGMYVVLDLQAGRSSLLAQARRYKQLLELPNVGLAIDPEWKLQPGELPLRQIGSVGVGEVNGVARWLAGLTARYRLPQKLLVLHQFRLSMITGEERLDTRHDDLAIVIHMDGQGTQADKLQTWRAVTGAAPRGVFFGWKNFFAKDHPVLSPRQTMANFPQPVMISYQ